MIDTARTTPPEAPYDAAAPTRLEARSLVVLIRRGSLNGAKKEGTPG